MSNTEDTLQALASLLKGVSEKNKYLESENTSLRAEIDLLGRDWKATFDCAIRLREENTKDYKNQIKELTDALKFALDNIEDLSTYKKLAHELLDYVPINGSGPFRRNVYPDGFHEALRKYQNFVFKEKGPEPHNP